MLQYQIAEGMGYPSPYFLMLIKVDRISIIGSNADLRKSLPVPPAAHLVVDGDHYAGCDKGRENIDVA